MSYQKPIQIAPKSHSKFKKYCQKNEISMSEAMTNLIDFVVEKNIHPAYFDPIEREYNIENWNKVEGNILEKIAELRNTYVGFQRKFEEQYRRDIGLIKETSFYNSKRNLDLLLEGPQHIKVLSSLIEQLILTDIKAQLEHKTLSKKQEKRLQNLDISKEVALIIDEKNVTINRIFTASSKAFLHILGPSR